MIIALVFLREVLILLIMLRGKALIIYPEECFGIDTLKREKDGMEKLYLLGYNDGKKIEEYLKTIKNFA